MEPVVETCPPDDRTPERRVFPEATRQVLGMAMRRGCDAAGLALYSPHDLRHRYASVKIREGVPVTDLAAQLGHARKSEEHTSELQSRENLVCRLLLEKK